MVTWGMRVSTLDSMKLAVREQHSEGVCLMVSTCSSGLSDKRSVHACIEHVGHLTVDRRSYLKVYVLSPIYTYESRLH